jgi:hypothetical protein
MARYFGIGAMMMLLAGAAQAHEGAALIVTSSNTPNNQLLVYGPTGALLKQIPTQGQGGVGGNAGGIAQNRDRLAVVNFGSGNVSVFVKDAERGSLHLESVVAAIANPVSVAFSDDHLYILTTTHVESHPISHGGVTAGADGSAALLVADGSAAQVGVVTGQLIISEKSNVIETVNVNRRGAVAGKATLVANIPANVNAPFGLATRGRDAYVTIAHADEIGLVRNDEVLAVTGSGTQHSPCWVTLAGPYLFSANSPSHSVSRYVIHGQKITQDEAVVASFNGSPTDITYGAGLVAVVDSDGTVSHLSVFDVDEDGTFGLFGVATISTVTTNGVAILY